MTERERVQFQDGSERMLVQLTEQQRRERGATATAAPALRQQRKLGGAAETVEQKKTLTDEGYKKNQKFHRQRHFLKDQNTISIGAVLKEQRPLVRREMFRRRLFPIRFEESARSVEEVQQLLMQRKPFGQLVISVCYLAALLVFISYSLEVNRIFEAANGVSSPIKSALAPTVSNFNSLSYEVAKAEGTTPTPPSVADFSELGHPADMLMMSSKAGVASWLLYGFIPLLYGPSPQTSNLGSARVIGNCFRLTFRQVELKGVDGFDLGYEGGWPLAAAEASSSIAASKLRSDNPLVNPPGSRFTYSYPFASPGEDKSFNQSGGHYQVICKDSIQAAQTALQQNQSPSRYPPWFVPLPVIADRRTISTVVDFFVINPVTATFSHCAVLFSFTSSGTLLRPLVWVSSLIPFSVQSDGVVRYTSLGLLLALLIFSLLWEYGDVKKMGFKSWCQRGRTCFLIFHLLLLLGFLASFVCVQVIALLAPKLELAVAASGYYNILSAPTAAGETGFFQLVSDYGHLFRLSSITQQVCAIFGALVALTGCVLIAMLSPAMAGSGTKSLQMTLRKVKFYMLACSVGLLSIVLIFVSLGNISFGAATRSFAGYYESLTTSAAFLLGGTLGNYDVYTMSSVNSILAGIFFVPLFLVFSAFGFTILTAVVLRKHNLCADSVQQGVLKYKLEKQDLFQTRYEWLRHAVASGCSSFWAALRGCWEPQRMSVLEEESHEGFHDDVEEAAASKKEKTSKKFRSRWREKGKDPIEREQHAEKKHLSVEEDDDSPPQYPSWVWQAMGMEDPINMYSVGSGEKKSFYVDPASVGEEDPA